MSLPTINEIYNGVSQKEIDELIEFRHTHQYITFEYKEKNWRYQKDGHGESDLLFIAGGLKTGEAWFRYINYYREQFRCFAPTYPDNVNKTSEVIGALEGIIEKEKMKNITVIGTSLGGIIAQLLIRQSPNKIKKVIVANTSHPNPQWAKTLRLRIPLVSIIPSGIIQTASLKRLKQYSNPTNIQQKSFFDAYAIEIGLYQTNKEWILNHYRLIIDYCEHQLFKPSDLDNWKGRMLLVESEDDLFPESTREEMRRLYPKADIYRFQKGAGHSPAITSEAEYKKMLDNFIN